MQGQTRLRRWSMGGANDPKTTFSLTDANRLVEIERNTHIENWRHKPTKFNPAGKVSWGCSSKQVHQEIHVAFWSRLFAIADQRMA